jgi:hypothetical protein
MGGSVSLPLVGGSGGGVVKGVVDKEELCARQKTVYRGGEKSEKGGGGGLLLQPEVIEAKDVGNRVASMLWRLAVAAVTPTSLSRATSKQVVEVRGRCLRSSVLRFESGW